MNLIPEQCGETPNYWCTWGRQNNIIEESRSDINFAGDQGARTGRNNINEEVIFGSGGWAEYYPSVRSDLYMVFDDGWDVPYDVHPDRHLSEFGSVIPDAIRFPSFSGTPSERLKKLNRELQQRGWKGLGLWIAAQAKGERKDHVLSPEDKYKYWKERLEWTRDAGIEFWKVDWGLHSCDLHFRRFLSELAAEIVPGLILEHSVGSAPLNGLTVLNPHLSAVENPEHGGSGRFIDMGGDVPRRVVQLQQFSEMTRFYDLTGPLDNVAAIDRLVFFLTSAGHGYLNVEDQMYLGAASGCCLGIMRSSENRSYVSHREKRLREVVRAVRWQRLAPAYKSANEPINTSCQISTDTWKYSVDDTWCSDLIEQMVSQSAPWGVARNMQVPTTTSLEENGDLPFVVSMLHPNGCASIAVFHRTNTERGFYIPKAKIRMPIDCSNRKIAIFGSPEVLELPVNGNFFRIYGQDLAANEARDISHLVTVSEGVISVTAKLIEELTVKEPGDISDPGILLAIESI